MLERVTSLGAGVYDRAVSEMRELLLACLLFQAHAVLGAKQPDQQLTELEFIVQGTINNFNPSSLPSGKKGTESHS